MNKETPAVKNGMIELIIELIRKMPDILNAFRPYFECIMEYFRNKKKAQTLCVAESA